MKQLTLRKVIKSDASAVNLTRGTVRSSNVNEVRLGFGNINRFSYLNHKLN